MDFTCIKHAARASLAGMLALYALGAHASVDTVNGSIIGLKTTGLVLLDSRSGASVSPSPGDTRFTMTGAEPIADAISIQSQPTGQRCAINDSFIHAQHPLVTCQTPSSSVVAGSTPGPSSDGRGTAAVFNMVNAAAVAYGGDLYVADNGALRRVDSRGYVSTIALKDGLSNNPYPYRDIYRLASNASGTLFAWTLGDVIVRIDAQGHVIHVAGSGVWGYADGPANVATFGFVRSIAADNAGNIYVLDADNQRIRKVAANGNVSTLAGSGQAGYVDGVGASAAFDFTLAAVVVDSHGNLFIAESSSNVVRKVTPSGVVTTFAGGSFGVSDGLGSQASFSGISMIAIDAHDNLYAMDGTSFIRMIMPNSWVSTLDTSLNGVFYAAVTVSPSGDLFLSNWGYVAQIVKMTFK